MARTSGKGGHAHIQVSTLSCSSLLFSLLFFFCFPSSLPPSKTYMWNWHSKNGCIGNSSRSVRSLHLYHQKLNLLLKFNLKNTVSNFQNSLPLNPVRSIEIQKPTERERITLKLIYQTVKNWYIGSKRMRGSDYNLGGKDFFSSWCDFFLELIQLVLNRETVALLLHTPDRADWKQCAKSDEEEKKDCQRFKAAFKSFDPST